MNRWFHVCVRFYLYFFVALVLNQTSTGQSTAYDASIMIASSGKPMFRMMNHHRSSITGFAVTVDVTGGAASAEYRRYYDTYVDPSHDQSIAPEQSVTIPIGYVVGFDVSRLSPQVRAVTYSDGTTIGDAIWIAAIRERRRRTHAIIRKISELLDARSGTEARPEDVLSDLSALQSAIDSMPLDDFRIVEDAQLRSANTTIERARKRGMKTDTTIRMYNKALRWRRTRLEESGSLVDKYGLGKQESTSVPPLPWDNMASRKTAQVVLSLDKTSDFAFTPAVLHFDDFRMFSRGVPRLKLSSISWTCYINSWLDTVVLTGGCSVGGTDSNQRFDLKAEIGAFDPISGSRIFYQYDNGEATAYGTCWAAYTDCDGTGHSEGIKIGKVNQHFMHDDGVNIAFTWIMDSWNQPTTYSCLCDDPNPDGIDFNDPINSVYTVGMLYLKDEQLDACLVNYSP